MKINLNDFASGGDVKVFNEGRAGRVTNVSVSVKRKTQEDKQNAPDFHLIYTDSTGAFINDGIYFPTEKDTPKGLRIRVGRLVDVLYALNPDLRTKKLPEFEGYREAIDFLMKQIATNSKNSLVNVFVTYGTVGKPSQYLGLRLFNFIEPASTTEDVTRLKTVNNPNSDKRQYNDNLERVKPTSFEMNDMSVNGVDSVFDDSQEDSVKVEAEDEDIDW